jgi:hypothetical protein
MYFKSLFLIALSHLLAAQDSPMVVVGKSIILSHSGAHHLRFHRKGVAEAVSVETDSAEIICLKPGLSLIYFVDETGEVTQKQSLQCIKPDTTVESGATDSFKDWLRTRAQCKPKCIFDQKLSAKGQAELKNWLKSVLPPDSSFEINAIDLKVFQPCPEKQKIHIPGADFYCKQISDQRYVTRVKIILENRDKNILYQGGLTLLDQGQAQIHFAHMTENSKAEIIAQPSFLITPEAEVHLQSGGEFPELTEQGHTSQWKRFGLKLMNKLRLNHGHLLLQSNYELSFKEGRSLKSHELKSEIPVQTGVFILLGQGEMTTLHESHQHPLGLDAVPILAPLFKEERRHSGHVSVQYWVMLEAEGKNGFKPSVLEHKEESRRF